MGNPVERLIVLGGSALAGAVVSAFVLGAAPSPAVNHRIYATPDAAPPHPMCSADGAKASEATFYSEMGRVSARMHERMEIAPSGNTDRDFVRMMIPHHQGAIEMVLVQLKYGRDERLRRLAQSIIVEQGQEIAYMRSLLDTRSGGTSSANQTGDQ